MVILSDTFVAHLNEVVDLDELAAERARWCERSLAPLGQHEPGKPRFFAGVLMYEHGPNAGEPATADADEYLRQYYDAKQRHTEVAAALRPVRARLERRREGADRSATASSAAWRRRWPPDYALFRPIRIHPMLGDELRAIADRYEQIVCIEANDGQYADMVELALRREVKRVPLLGGRI